MSPPPTDHPSRRDFLAATGAAAAGGAIPAAAAGRRDPLEVPPALVRPATDESLHGPVTLSTIAEAEKLAGISFTDAERRQMVETMEEQLDRLRARQRLGAIPVEDPPAHVFDPRLPGIDLGHVGGGFAPSRHDPSRPPDDDADLAHAPIGVLSAWIRDRSVTCQHLARVYLERLERLGPGLECVITLLRDEAMARARELDIEIASGRYRGPLHGIPWGAKDLLDTAGIRTTWGATPYRDRVAAGDAAVVERLDAAGAVLAAKLTLGALAYGDIWYGGRTRNPWNPEQGSSGSSAGSAAATAAGLVGFSLGTETYGSIVSPCMRCGATGLRPTFGRVSRRGAMPLCWSLDKIGPIGRRVEDCMLVLDAINGRDDGDPASIEMPLAFSAGRSLEGVRLGYDPAWFEGDGASDLDRAALAAARRLGVSMVEIELPDWPYDALLSIIMVESAAVFESLTRDGRDDELRWQEAAAWPNSFRQTWFLPAVEMVQVDRFRRRVMAMMAERFDRVDALLSPSYAGSLLLITNATGHPSLTLRSGFRDDGTPSGITLWGRLYDEGTLANIGMALEDELDVWHRRPGEG